MTRFPNMIVKTLPFKTKDKFVLVKAITKKKREELMKSGTLIKQRHPTGYMLYADPNNAKILKDLCWCCGGVRVAVRVDRTHWKEICFRKSKGLRNFKPRLCKYYKNGNCHANGRADGNCKGTLTDSRARRRRDKRERDWGK